MKRYLILMLGAWLSMQASATNNIIQSSPSTLILSEAPDDDINLDSDGQSITVGDVTYKLYRSDEAHVYTQYYTGSGELEIPEVVNFRNHDFPVTGVEYFGTNNGGYVVDLQLPTTVTFVNNVKSGVKTLKLPKSVTSVTGLHESADLEGFEVAEGNESFSVDDRGVLYSKDKTTLYYAPYAKRSSFTSYAVPSTVTRIGGSAFYGFQQLTSVTFSEGLKTIGNYAFYHCSSLTSCKMPSTVESIGSYAFESCNLPSSLVLPSSLGSISEYAFSSAFKDNYLRSLTIPENVETIGDYAFWLTVDSVYVHCPPITIGGYAFGPTYNILVVPKGTRGIFSYYSGWKQFNKFVEGDFDPTFNVSDYPVGEWTLDSDGQSITQDGVTYKLYRSDEAHVYTQYYTGRGELEIPESVYFRGHDFPVTGVEYFGVSNGGYAVDLLLPTTVTFVNNVKSGVKTLKLPKSVTSVTGLHESADLEGFEVAEGNESFSVDDRGVLYSKDKTTLYYAPYAKRSSFTSYAVPSTVTRIGGSAFYGFQQLTSVTFSEGLKTIGNYAFYHCSSLTSCKMPSTVESIGSYAFESCNLPSSLVLPSSLGSISECAFSSAFKDNYLRSLTIPENVETIGDYAFWLTVDSVYVHCPPITIGGYAFGPTYNILVVPKGTRGIFSYYSGWKQFNKFVEGDFDPTFNVSDYPVGEWTLDSDGQSITQDGVTYKLYRSDEAHVYTQYYTGRGELEIPESVYFRGHDFPVTGVEYFGVNNGGYAVDLLLPTTVTFVNNVKSGVKTLKLPKSVTSVTGLDESSYLEGFEVAEGNESFSVDDRGVLYSKDKTTLYYAPYAKRSSFTSYAVPSTVTRIGGSAFYGFQQLTSVTFSEGLKTIDNYAFYHCSSLTSCKMPSTVESIGSYAFESCNLPSSLVLPSSLGSISEYAFSSAFKDNYLRSLTIPENVETIGDYAFWLTVDSVYVHCPPITIGGYAFGPTYNILVVPKGTRGIFSYYSGWKQFNKFVEGDFDPTFNVSDYPVGEWTLDSDGQSITQDGVTYKLYRSDEAHVYTQYYTGRGELEIPESVYFRGHDFPVTGVEYFGVSNGGYAVDLLLPTTVTFVNNVKSGVKTLKLPKSVTSVTGLDESSYLEGFEVAEGNESFSVDDRGVLYSKDKTTLYYAPYAKRSSFTSYAVPSTVTRIGGSAFYGFQQLTSVTFSEGLKTIDNYAFYHCSSLTSCKMPSTVESIGSYAFESCNLPSSLVLPSSLRSISEYAFSSAFKDNYLRSLTIPENVETIGDYAFWLTVDSVYTRIMEPMAIGSYAFGSNSSRQVLVVPTGTKDKYAGTDGWKNIATIIESEALLPSSVRCIKPTFTRDADTLTIRTEPLDATIYYTMDGKEPKANSLRYRNPIVLTENCVVKAIAMKDGLQDSPVAEFEVDWFTVDDVEIKMENLQIVMSTKTPGATIRYTVDGTDPTEDSPIYQGHPISLAEDCTIKAVGVKKHFNNSAITIFVLKWSQWTCLKPTFRTSGKQIFIETSMADVTIYYTLDGTEPTTASTLYEGPLTLTENKTVKAIVVKEGFRNSPVGTYQVGFFEAEPVSFRLENLKIAMSTATEGAVIHYTLDGNDPTVMEKSFIYKEPLDISELEDSCIIKAVATKAGFNYSEVTEYMVDKKPVTCAAPTFRRSGNTVIIESATSGSTIYYTMNDAIPTEKDSLYNQPVAVNHNFILRAFAKKDGLLDSEPSMFKVDWMTVADVQFRLVNLQVEMITTTEGAVIRYTLDGSNPTENSPIYQSPLSLADNCTIKAVGMKPDYNNSNVTTFELDWKVYTCAKPTFRRSGTQLVIETSTMGGTIYYTLDNTEPTTESMVYKSPITPQENCIVRAVVMKEGLRNSEVSEYKIDWLTVAEVTFDIVDLKVTMATATPGAVIRNTIDGSEPTETSPIYQAPIPLPNGTTVKAFAMKPNFNSSAVTSYLVDLDKLTCATPTFYLTNLQLTIETQTMGGTIYYTMDGTEPTKQSAVYEGPFTMTRNCTVKAVVMKDGFRNSNVASYTVDLFDAEPVTFRLANLKIDMSSSTEGAIIYYTLDGSDPSQIEQSYIYNEPLSITELADSSIIKAIATKDGYNNSVVKEYMVSKKPVTCATPTFRRVGNIVVIESATGSSTIYYTINGAEPTEQDLLYNGPVTVDQNYTIRAFAKKEGLLSSVSAAFEVDWFQVSNVMFGIENLRVVMKTVTPDAVIRYTVNGKEPNEQSTIYQKPISVSEGTVVKAFAMKDGFNNSDVTEYTVNFSDVTCATPTFRRSGIQVVIETSTLDGVIYYTLDGSEPTKSSKVYDPSTPIEPVENCTVKAVVMKDGFKNSEVASFTINWMSVADVQIKLVNLQIEMSTTTEGATIRYTLDGSTPTVNSPAYQDMPLSIAENCTIKAVAMKQNLNNSNVTTFELDWSVYTCAMPSFRRSGTQLVIETSTVGGIIYYTLDNTEPTLQSLVYKTPIMPKENGIIRAVVMKDGLRNSSVSEFKIDWMTVSDVTFDIVNLQVVMSTSTPDAIIRYTTDGSEPTEKSLAYQGPVTLPDSTTVKAFGMKSNYNNSKVTSYLVDLSKLTCAAPDFYLIGQQLTIETQTTGSTIYYTMDGTEPTSQSAVYESPLILTRNCTVKAVVMKDEMRNSPVATYLVDFFETEPVTFRLSNLKIEMSSATEDAVIHYTLDGSDPTVTEQSFIYREPLDITELADSIIIRAIATKNGFNNSVVKDYMVNKKPVTCATPTFRRSGNTVIIESATGGSSIYYTINEASPTEQDKLYTGPVAVDKNYTIRAFAKKEGLLSSAVGVFQINWFQVANVMFGIENLRVVMKTETQEAVIRYTVNGQNPTAQSAIYQSPLNVSEGTIVKAFAMKDGFNDSEITEYTVNFSDVTCATPTFRRSGNQVVIETSTLDGVIYYTLDGSEPTKNSKAYDPSTPIEPVENCTVKAVVMKDGYRNSEVASFTVNWMAVADVQIKLVNLQIEMSTSTEGATIRYTLDGSTPTVNSPAYQGLPLSIVEDCTIKAIAMKENFSNSNVASFELDWSVYTCAKPSFRRSGTQLVIETSTVGGTIYYTLYNMEPTTESLVYKSPITPTENSIVRAVVVKDGMRNSEVSEFTVDWMTVSDVRFDIVNLQVVMSTSTPDAIIRYTTDGSEPTEKSPAYQGPLTLPDGTTIKAFAMKTNYNNSAVTTYQIDLSQLTCAAPNFYMTNFKLTIETQTMGGIIYYTMDGTEPTQQSSVYEGPVTLTRNCTVKAVVMKDGFRNSEMVSYIVDFFVAEPVTFSLANLKIEMSSATEDAVIHYTLDGSDPTVTEQSLIYSEPLDITELSDSSIIRAIATKNGFNNSVVKEYMVNKKPITCATPTFRRSGNTVIMECATGGSSIYYTINGANPTEQDMHYNGPVAVDKNYSIRAIAKKDGLISSAVGEFQIDWFQVANVTFEIDRLQVVLKTETAGAVIRYSVNGKNPTRQSAIYQSPLNVSEGTTVKAFAMKDGFNDSEITEYTVNFDEWTCATPTIRRSGTLVVIDTSTQEGTIYYTLDGSEPTKNSNVYDPSLPVEPVENCTVKAVVMKDGFKNSEVASFTVDWMSVADVQIKLVNLQIEMSTSTEGATIRYTLDGSTPTVNSPAYQGMPLSIAENCTIKAVAMKQNFNNSNVTTFELDWSVYTCAKPTFRRSGTQLVIETSTVGGTIYYTLNNTEPTTQSLVYKTPITPEKNGTVRAVVIKEGMRNSEVGEFTVDWMTVSDVRFDIVNLQVVMSTSTPDAIIRYTTDGSEPTETSRTYQGPISLPDSTMIKAVGMKPDFNNSRVSSYLVDLSRYTCSTPFFHLEGLQLTIESQTTDGTIHYTMDGTEPTKQSVVYREPITLTRNCTVKAVVIKEGFRNSPVESYEVSLFQVVEPTFAVDGTQLTIECNTEGATIYYGFGETTEPSILYEAPITLTDNQTVRAIGRREGYKDSPVAEYVHSLIACQPATLEKYDGRYFTLSGTDGSTVFYTLDGSTPTEQSARYSGRTPVTGLCTLKTMATRPWTNHSEVMSYDLNYFFNGDTAIVTAAGQLSLSMEWSRTSAVSSLTVAGPMDDTDLAFIKEKLTSLRHLNLKDAAVAGHVLPSKAFAGMNLVTFTSSNDINSVGDSLFIDCPQLAAIVWNASEKLPASSFGDHKNPNMLVYVVNKVLAPTGVRNVVVNGIASDILLSDADGNNDFYCPVSFKANKISYTHHYSLDTQSGQCMGWETVALPFTVQRITHYSKGDLTPFKQFEEDGRPENGRPFWLRELTETGFEDAATIEANTPYIISMPNSKEYAARYNLAGNVTFSAEDAEVAASSEVQNGKRGGVSFIPTFARLQESNGIWAINRDSTYEDYPAGSLFVPSFREVRPFEAYATSEQQVRYISIVEMNNEELTSIQDFMATHGDDKYYNLQGLPVSKLTNGLYIKDGKKVVRSGK